MLNKEIGSGNPHCTLVVADGTKFDGACGDDCKVVFDSEVFKAQAEVFYHVLLSTLKIQELEAIGDPVIAATQI